MLDATLAPPLTFFHTLPMPCPYLPGLQERRLVCDLSTRRGRHAHDQLAKAGFRRTQHLAYRPACASCSACVPVRLRTADFRWTRGHRRVLKANADLTCEVVPNEATREQFELFERYQVGRHGDGEMALMDYPDYAAMVERSPIETALLEYRDARDNLWAAVLIDRQDDGLSAVYSFFEPGADKRALGRFMILDLVRHTAAQGLPYVYLGYWVSGSRKMAYKTSYQPVESLSGDGWVELIATTP
ncbi:arginine-tRNA-protein transferase [alpha proteobacterium BAL199]|jgi:leucyl-tRNA---protein transferase|nr:arginine-tRNA-protein transferase [alpha proteobacterium BAL199]